jgi:hypothetical protein
MGRENKGDNSRGRSKSKDRSKGKSKGKSQDPAAAKRVRNKARDAAAGEEEPAAPVAPAALKRQGAFSRAAHHSENAALLRPVKLRPDALPWWGLHPRWDAPWPPELPPFQLPPPTDGAGRVAADQPGWAAQGREATACFSWGAGGEGRLGSGLGREGRCAPSLVNPARDPPLLGGPGAQPHAHLPLRSPAHPPDLRRSGGGGSGPPQVAAPGPTPSSGGAGRPPSRLGRAGAPEWAAWDGVSHARRSARLVGVACGARHALAVSDAGVVYSWGDGHAGQLGSRKVERWPPPRAGAAGDDHEGDDDDDEEDRGSRRAVGGSSAPVASGSPSGSPRSGWTGGGGQSAAQRALAAKRKGYGEKGDAGGKDGPRGLHEILTGTGAAAHSLQRVSLVNAGGGGGGGVGL